MQHRPHNLLHPKVRHPPQHPPHRYLKAIGVGTYEGVSLPDISIYKDENGEPKFKDIPNAMLTISHDAGLAVAVVVIV